MSNETPQVTDKRRFADRINDQEVIDEIRRADRVGLYDARDAPLDPSPASVGQFSPSSTPSPTPGMDFSTAIKEVLKGHRVTRLEWKNPEVWLYMFYWGPMGPKLPSGKYLSIHHADGSTNPLVISNGDMLGDDWVVVV